MTEELLQTELDSYLSVSDFARNHGMSCTTVLRYINEATLPSIHIDGRYFIRKDVNLEKEIIEKRGYIKVKEYSKKYFISESTVRNHARNGILPSVRINRTLYIDKNIEPPNRYRSHSVAMEEGYTSLSDFARKHGVNPGTVYNYIKRNQLDCRKRDGCILISEDTKLPSEINKEKRSTIENDGYISIDEYAKIHGYARNYVRDLARVGRLPAVKIGKYVYVKAEAKILSEDKTIVEHDGKRYIACKAFCEKYGVNYGSFRQKLRRYSEIQTVKIGSVRYIDPDTYSFIDRRKVRGKSK
jgi:DNA-binding CsgD family transcriptional regulator